MKNQQFVCSREEVSKNSDSDITHGWDLEVFFSVNWFTIIQEKYSHCWTNIEFTAKRLNHSDKP